VLRGTRRGRHRGHARSEAGRNPSDKALTELIGELSTRSETFRVRWAAHNFRFHRTGRKQLHHPIVGDLDLSFEAMELPGEDLTMLVYTAAPNSVSQQALDLLASWAATVDQELQQEQEAPAPPGRMNVSRPSAGLHSPDTGAFTRPVPKSPRRGEP
jgi:hypothetical protein